MRSSKFVLTMFSALAMLCGGIYLATGANASETALAPAISPAISEVMSLPMAPRAAPETYMIDAAHSYIGFSVRHLVINNIPGRFKEFSGTIQYDAADISKSSVEFKANAASIDTGIEGRDNHLRSADFFEVAKYPDLTFKSSRIERKGNDAFVAHGTFTLKGVSKEIAIPFKLFGPITDNRKKMRFGVEAALTINRQDYGITWSAKLDNGGLVVGNDVNISLNLEAVKQ